MNAIRIGDKGSQVKSWQYFLVGQGYAKVIADGSFGPATDAASKDFQKKNGLLPDGVIGNQSYLKAMQLGYGLVKDPVDDTMSGPNWPPPPDFKPLTASQITNLFGKFSFQIQPDGSTVKITDNWQAQNIISIAIPQIQGLPPYQVSKISVHKKAAPQFTKLFSAWDKAGLKKLILTFDGAFNPRLIRGSSTALSCHAFGIAVDINVPWNGLGVVPALKGRKGSVRELVKIANDCGFYWGGHFSRKDGMHFEIAKLL